MDLRRLKWLSIGAPIAFLALVELVRRFVLAEFAPWVAYVILFGIILLGIVLFSETIFRVIDQTQARLEQTNRELLALHEAGLDITGELELEAVLQRVVDEARALIGARYGALSLLREDGGGIEAFLTSGITPEERAAIGPIPVGHGLLGVVLEQGESLRTPDLTTHPRSVGFPPHHPPMRSLLAVPIAAHGRILGNLYLTETEAEVEFSVSDEETLKRFATQAALAIENARLHRQVRALAMAEERERIAREIHDSVAQVLGYVNTKAQAAEELLRAGQTDRAAGHIAQLGQAARDAYADVREHILGLRAAADTSRGFAETLRAYLERWEEQSGVAVALITEPEHGFAPRLDATGELQLLRIVQEALANVRKHSGARVVTVHLSETPEWVEARIEDNGRGFDPAELRRADYPRFGLAMMHERAESVGGAFEVVSERGTGTRVSVRLPAARAVAPVIARPEGGPS